MFLRLSIRNVKTMLLHSVKRFITLFGSLGESLQENDLEMRILALKSILPYYFYFKKTNYARYGTYYGRTMSI